MTSGLEQLPECRRQKEHRLRIICVNDVYSFAAVDGHGGWCRAATLMRKLKSDLLDRASSACSSTCDVLTFVNGDVMGGSSLLQHSKGRLAIDIMNEIPTDGCVLGNHEFDYGPSALDDCISASNFNWFGSNVVKADSSSRRLLDGVLDYQVKVLKSGLKVGVFGLCTQATPHLSNPSRAIEFLNAEETARRVVSHLREVEGAQVVIALTHLAAAQDKQLSESVEGIDVILGGHDHEPLAFEHHHTLVFKTGQNCYWVGSVDVDILIDEGGSHDVQVFPSWSMHSTCRVKEDRGVEAIVDRYQRLVDEEILLSHGDALQGMTLDDVVAKVTGDTLDTRTAQVRRKESSSGNFIADALLSYYGAGKYQTDGIDTMAFINGGFIRGDKRYVAGTNLTLRDVLEEMPFPKVSCFIELQGKYLWQAMEQQLRACPAASGGFPHISANASIEYDINLPPLSRIKKFMINGREVNEDRKYRVVVTDFVASGGDGASAWCFGAQQSIEGRPSTRISAIVLNYLKNTLCGNLQAKVEGRVRCIVD